MLARMIHTRVPLPAVVMILALTSTAAILAVLEVRQAIFSYHIVLPQSGGDVRAFRFGSWPALSNPEYFESVRNALLEEEATFLEADLSAMRLRFFESGSLQKEVPILTKGREGSWWETPVGLYKIEGKAKRRFSGFSGVYMPWTMPFQGNFFIHGWPYYPDGTPVASTYSGGCIRLADADAEALFGAVAEGTPVLVFEKDFSSDAFEYAQRGPEVAGKSYLAADLMNNFVFGERNSTSAFPIASITKLMTAAVAVEYINIERDIAITPSMLAATTTIPRLQAGETWTLYDLLHPLLLESSNEAAFAIATVLGPRRFVDLMNEKAKAIGMAHARFTDPAGIDGGNVASAEDIFHLAKYLYHNRSFILRMTAGRAVNATYGAPRFSGLTNTNHFADDPAFLGGKIGKSGATGETMLALFEVSFPEGPRPVAIVILGSDDRRRDVRAIRAYVANQFAGSDRPGEAAITTPSATLENDDGNETATMTR